MASWIRPLERRLSARVAAKTIRATLRDPGAAARFIGWAYVGGTALSLVSMAVPQPPGTNVTGLFALYLVAFLVGALLLLRGERVTDPELFLVLLVGTGLVTLGMHFSADRTGVYSMFYVWIVLNSFFCLPTRWAFAEIAGVGAAYALVLAVERPAGAEEQWVIAVGTVLVVGVIVGVLKAYVEGLIARLANAAQTDPLTELRNRRGFQEALELELERAERSGDAVSLLVADLDHFKRVNDRIGHPGGDRVLKRFADQMQRLSRRPDVAARLGGEEFALLLPEAGKGDAYLVAERLRRAVRAGFADDPVPLTVSIGVASWPADGGGADDLLLAGDQALYAAKQLGRDRSVLFNAEVVADLMRESAPREASTESQLSSVLVLAETIDMRDSGTAAHSQTVGRYAGLIATRLGLPARTVTRVGLAGVLHDVGKIGVRDVILQKPGPLDDNEWAEMRKHSELGARLLSGAGLEDLAEWVFAHHERLDGGGYPLGLSGDQIPLEARILAVADAYEAMTSARVYSPAMSAEEAEAELRRGVGRQFDEAAVEALLTALREGRGDRSRPARSGVATLRS